MLHPNTMQRMLIATPSAILAATWLYISGYCGSPSSTVTSQLGQMQITGEQYGFDTLALTGGEDSALLSYGKGGTLLIDETRVIIDGSAQAIIPEGTDTLEIEIRRGTPQIRADGHRILRQG